MPKETIFPITFHELQSYVSNHALAPSHQDSPTGPTQEFRNRLCFVSQCYENGLISPNQVDALFKVLVNTFSHHREIAQHPGVIAVLKRLEQETPPRHLFAQIFNQPHHPDM